MPELKKELVRLGVPKHCKQFSPKDNKAKDESTSCRFSKKLPIQQLLKHAGCHTLNQEEYMLLVRILQERMIPELFK